jgi:hypothetical protein
LQHFDPVSAAFARYRGGATMNEDDQVTKALAALRTSRRINVIGTSGTGKTTFCRELSSVLGVPCREMDRMYWQAGWTSDEEEFLAGLKAAISGPAWVLDGNYNRTNPVKWENVECVVWLDYSFATTFSRAVRRALERSATGREIWPGTGNRETFRKSFFSRDSIILWTLTTFRSNRAKYRTVMNDEEGRAFAFVRLGSPADTGRVIRMLRQLA